MNIGQAAKISGVSAKMIRYYESIELIPAAGRTSGGYRDYEVADIHRLSFIRRARDLGLSYEQTRELLNLWGDQKRSSSDLKVQALDYISELEARANLLNDMILTLRHLVDMCNTDHRPEYPLLSDAALTIA